MASCKELKTNFNKYARDKMRKIFDAAQKQYGHQKLLEKCRKLQKKCDNENKDLFFKEFTYAIKFVFVFPEKLAVDNILSFISKYVIMSYVPEEENELLDTTVDEAAPFMSEILNFLCNTHGASLVDARLRCMQLLSKILSGMPENSLISDEIWKKLKETVLCRLQDKNLAVRAQAVLTARMLQDPKNSNCEIIKALIFHFNDPSPPVRRAVTSSIALNKQTIGHVLARTRDVSDNVRRNAYLVFSKIKCLNLTIKYRITILERGLQDRSEMVKKCAEQLVVVNWYENFNKDLVKFLEALDVVNCSDIAIKTIEALIKTQPIDEILRQLPLLEETKLISKENLSPEVVLLWRSLAYFFWREGKEEELELIIPNLTILCDFIRDFYLIEEQVETNLNEEAQWAEIKNKEILMHLLQLVKVYDLRDEMGRSKLKELIIDILISSRIQNNQIKSLVELLALVIPSKDSFIQELTEVISEIRQPLRTATTQVSQRDKLDRDLKLSDLKVKLNELQESEYNAVQNKNYAEAQELKNEIEKVKLELKQLKEDSVILTQEVNEEKNDPVTLCKCLSILKEMITYSNVKALTPNLMNLRDNFLNQCISSRDLLTQSLAIEISAQYCILDKKLARQNLIRFLLMISEDGDNEITVPSLKGVFDIIQTHGLKPLEQLDTNDENDVKGSNLNGRSKILNSENVNFEEDSLLLNELNESLSEIKCLKNLKDLLLCETNDALKTIAYEGLCKLLLCGIIYSPSILSRIIIKGFSPIIDCESEDFIRQTFVVFFPIFASTTPRSQEMIESVFIPTLKAIDAAPLGSPDADINLKDVIVFLIDNTKADINKFTAKTLHVHNNLGLSLCHQIFKDLENEKNSGNLIQVYLRALNLLDISIESESFFQQMQTLVTKIEEKLDDSSCLRSLLNFKSKLIKKLQLSAFSSIQNTLSSRASSKALINEEDLFSNINLSTPLRKKGSAPQLSIVNETSVLDDNCSLKIAKPDEDDVIVPESPDISD